MKKLVLVLMMLFASFTQADDFVDAFSPQDVTLPLEIGTGLMVVGILTDVAALTLVAVPEFSIPAAIAIGLAGGTIAIAGAFSTTIGLVTGLSNWAGLTEPDEGG